MTPAQALVQLAKLGIPGEKLGDALQILEAMEAHLMAPTIERRAKDRARKSREPQGHSEEFHGTSTEVHGESEEIQLKKEIPHTPLEKTTHHLEPTGAREADGKPTNSRGVRLPPDFSPIPSIVDLAVGLGLTESDLSDQLERFRDWANAATGQVSIKRDWQAAFRNWIKRAADDRKKSHNRQGPRQSISDALDRQREDLQRRFGSS